MKFKRKWKRKDIILLLERLELYTSSGLSIDKTLRISAEGISRRQKIDMENISKFVEAGGLLSEGLYKIISISGITTGLIENGESSGSLSNALLTARLLLEREDELLKKCTGAMAYPIVIGLFAMIMTIGLVRGVMPQIIPMLMSLHVQLPLLTRITISFSNIVTKYGVYILFIFILLLTIFSFVYKKIYFIKKICHIIILKIPIVGKLFRSYSISVFLRSYGSLIDSGLDVTKAYKKTARAVTLLPLRESLMFRVIDINRGVSIGNVVAKSKMPSYIAPLLHAGEASGTLGPSLSRAALILDRDIEHTLHKLTSLIEPVMMAGMGFVVGAIALSIMMPIYDISKVLQH